jgi:thioredoxin 1
MAGGKEVQELDGHAFQELLAGTDRLVVVEFYMEGCPGCQTMAPVLDALANELPDGAVLVKVDARENLDLALGFGVVATPTVLLFCRGTFLMEMVGVVSLAALRGAIGDTLQHRQECAGRPMSAPL